MSVKILVQGDVGGSIDAFAARIRKVHGGKAGPFAAVLCVGTFFGALETQRAEMKQYLSGAKTLPLPVYFVTGDEPACAADTLAAALADVGDPSWGGQLCPNLHYLGTHGIAEVAGLTVAYMSGKQMPRHNQDGANPYALHDGAATDAVMQVCMECANCKVCV